MIPGLSLIEKIVGFGLDLFVRRSATNRRLKEQFSRFVKRAGEGAKESSDMHEDYKEIRKDESWKKK